MQGQLLQVFILAPGVASGSKAELELDSTLMLRERGLDTDSDSDLKSRRLGLPRVQET
jgi:hypothetical protein